jgi:hypothetical protein
MNLKTKIFVAAFLLVFVVIGLYVTGQAIYWIVQSQRAEAWPTVPATLRNCNLEDITDESLVTYRVAANYSYEVNGRAFDADCIAFGYKGSGIRENEEALRQKLATARTVSVRYDPQNPTQCALVCGINGGEVNQLIFGIIWNVFTWTFIILIVISQHPNRKIIDQIEVD